MNENTQSPRDLSARDVLIGRDRIRGASRMISDSQTLESVTPETIAQVAADLESFRRAHKLTKEKIAESVGYSPGVIVEFIKGTYRGNQAGVAKDVDAWLEAEQQRLARPATTTFTWTNVAIEIKAAATYCLDYRSIGLIYGPETSGMGKTTALKAIAETLGHKRATMVTFDKVAANMSGVLKAICDAMRVDRNGSNAIRLERLVARLQNRSHILLLDEIHSLRHSKDDKPFYVLTQLHDRTGCAQLWCGTADLVAYFERQQGRNADESLAQIRGRIFPIVDLVESVKSSSDGGGVPLVTVQQIRDMFASNELKLTTAAARFLMTLANQPDSGCLRLCVKLVEFATNAAKHMRATSLDIQHLRMAVRRSFTPRRADMLLHRIDPNEQGGGGVVAAAG